MIPFPRYHLEMGGITSLIGLARRLYFIFLSSSLSSEIRDVVLLQRLLYSVHSFCTYAVFVLFQVMGHLRYLNILAVLSVVFVYTTGNIIVQDNVMFYKTNEISTTRAKWLATIVIDFDQIEKFVSLIAVDIEQAKRTLESVMKRELTLQIEPFQ